MKILELELTQYIRLSLNNIRYFKLTLKEIVQLILGTNGSGKSSVLYELTPLPASDKNYYKGGRKRIVLTHNGKTYELISDFKNGQDHYFYVDGENLNIGRNVTMQKELVKEHFNITTETHKILLGVEDFTDMSATRRREVFTMLCSVDYTFAIKLYKKITEALRDTQGSLKKLKKRLGEETMQALKEEEIASMRARLADLNRESQTMYMLRNADALSVFDARDNTHRTLSDIATLTEQFHGVRKILKDKCYIMPEEYQMDIESVRDQLSGVEAVYGRLAEEFMNASVEVNSVADLEAEDVGELEETIVRSNKLAKELMARRKQPLEGFNALRASQSMDVVYESLYSVLTDLPTDPDGKMTSAALNEVMDKLRDRELSLRVNADKLVGFEHREKHLMEMANSEHIDCPKCEHKWQLGYSEDAHTHVKTRIAAGRAIVAKLKGEIDILTEQRDSLNAYSTLYREYIRITRSTPELQPLWNLINEEDAVRKAPSRALTIIELVRGDLQLEMQVGAIRDKITTDMKRLEMANYAQSSAIKAKKVRMDQLEQEIGRLSQEKVLIQNKLYELTTTQRQIKRLHEIGDKLRQSKEKFEQGAINIVAAVKNEVIDHALADTHREIAFLSTRIHSIDQQETLLNDLKQSITIHEKEEKAYKALASSLSPVDGLIAQGMLGFIRNYAARMNAIIAKIWTYRMEMHDCSTDPDSAELSYKFPVSTPNLPKPTPDVSETSAGQQEMLNLAFRIVAAQCLGLDRGWLALDEFGKAFDESHREAATQVVRQLLEQLNFSQLFMISHYEASYGAFYSAQVSVMDKRNITVPANRKVNELTVIEASVPEAA